MSDEPKSKPQPGPPSYCSMSGMPWVTSQMWFDALAGGQLNMQMIADPATAIPIPTIKAYKLCDEQMGAYGLPLNPSLFVQDGQVYANVRVCRPASGNTPTQNFLGAVRDGGLHDVVALKDETGLATAYGFEDIRIFVWQGQLWGVAAISTQGTAGSPRTGQCLVRVERDGRTHSPVPLVSKRHEKNWMPCVDGDVLRFVYATDPLIVLMFRDGAVSPNVDNLPDISSLIRGGSPLQRYKDGWIAVVHQIHAQNGAIEKAVYVHRFAVFDADLRSVRLSDPFYFRPGIEFCAGLVEHEGRWLLGMGVRDAEAWVLEVSSDVVDAFADGSIETPKVAVTSTVAGPSLRVAAGSRPVAHVPSSSSPAVPAPTVIGQPSPGAVPPTWNPLLGGFPPHGEK